MRFAMRFVLAVTLSGAAVRPAVAQIDSLRPGMRLRVERRGDSVLDGRLAALTDDSLTLTLADSSRSAVAWRDVFRVRVDRGPASVGRRGMRGAAVGVVVGLAAGFTAGVKECETGLFTKGQCEAASAIGGAVGGFILGFVVGAAIPGERWETLGGLPMTVGLSPRRFTVAVRLPIPGR